MIKVYLDWNVMSGMKNNYFPDLTDIISNKEKFLLVYSTSHIGDIFASIKNDSEQEQKLVQEDLEYITSLTQNLCLANDSKKVTLGIYDPGELLDDRISEAPLFRNLCLDSLFDSIESDNPMYGLVNSMKNMIAAIPLDNAFKEAFQNPESAQMLETMFPGLKDDLTMKGFFKSFGHMLHNMNEGEGYKDIRSIVQQVGISNGHFSQDKNPFDVIENAYKKNGIENFDAGQYFDNTKNAPEWFNDIINEYVNLDMHGFKADKVKVTDKEKNTFKNTTEDASHSAFASRCEFYITNDDRNYHKTRAVFQKLDINTIVLKPNEFVQYYNAFLHPNTFDEHFDTTIKECQSTNNYQEQKYSNGEIFGLVKYTNEYFFNFFNKLFVPTSKANDALFILSKASPAKIHYIHYREIEGMLKLFVDKFGVDINGKSYYEAGEVNNEEDWLGRTWEIANGSISIRRFNGWFQMYFFPTEKKTD
ncbi:hypothetical protein [Sphingobacterium sp. HMA12]|uniref:hypothetical protein n=1 Tax=Sphingobacterium sp. HMA12 TaxID=2050894 RepID=UPI000CE9CC21|nr:hypothetical protein [Sphingobacterium sp. HMA12]